MSHNGIRKLVFVGGGHAHLPALTRTRDFLQEGADVCLIAPERFHYYSGMGPGILSRLYEPHQARFDVQATVEAGGGSFVRGHVESVDPVRRVLCLREGGEIAYDLVSFNVGSRVPVERIPGAETDAIPVKPIENLVGAQERLGEWFRRGRPRVLVVGGGPAGVELAGNLLGLAAREKAGIEVTLAAAEDRLLPGFRARAGETVARTFTRRGVKVRLRFPVASLAGGIARSAGGDEEPFDLALLAIGIVPQPVFTGSGLETTADGALLVNPHLQSVSDPNVFGAGDCIDLRGHHLDRVGVHAVREAPILYRNLRATIRGEPLAGFSPQSRYLLILNLGDGTGLFVRGALLWRSRLALRFKNYLDTRFVNRFQVSGESPDPPDKPRRTAA